MATADEYAQWIVDNEDKKGSADFNTVVQAYQEAKATEAPSTTPSVADNVAGAAATAALGNFSPANPYGSTLSEAGQAIKTGAQAVANIPRSTLATAAGEAVGMLHGVPPGVATIAKSALGYMTPGSTATIGSDLASLGRGAMSVGRGALNAGKFLAAGAVAPENMFLAPYQMAAYEQEKIRANPTAPEYATNPYAMSYRSQGTANPITQGQAGAQNQSNVVANMPYGNVTPQERAILDKDKADRLKLKMQYQAAQRVLGQPQ